MDYGIKATISGGTKGIQRYRDFRTGDQRGWNLYDQGRRLGGYTIESVLYGAPVLLPNQ